MKFLRSILYLTLIAATIHTIYLITSDNTPALRPRKGAVSWDHLDSSPMTQEQLELYGLDHRSEVEEILNGD